MKTKLKTLQGIGKGVLAKISIAEQDNYKYWGK